MTSTPDDLGLEQLGAVGIIELRRPPHNYFDLDLITRVADACEAFDADPGCRAIVLRAQGKSFSAGADLSRRETPGAAPVHPARHTYREALRIFKTGKPIVAAIHGAAIGGGLGLALVADFRIGCAETRLSANFTRLGFHPGFGLTASLPRLIGRQSAALMFYTGRTVNGQTAHAMGLLDQLVPQAEVHQAALQLAQEFAAVAPLALRATRETHRRGLITELEVAMEREMTEQGWLGKTQDFQEGLAAVRERREPRFTGN
ncbi:MAG: enoyl-CoA hydratase/isomerase family protein [Burkholderiaceae bacterium]|nr:enoyl-CoA hydratase/isomerase family protein [Burkholderiaceae bacterium]